MVGKVQALRIANAVLRFALEICALAALSYWGFDTASGPRQLALGIGVPLLVVLVWGTFGAPKAPLRASVPLRLALIVVIYGWAVGALVRSGETPLAVAFGAVAAVNTLLLHLLGQE